MLRLPNMQFGIIIAASSRFSWQPIAMRPASIAALSNPRWTAIRISASVGSPLPALWDLATAECGAAQASAALAMMVGKNRIIILRNSHGVRRDGLRIRLMPTEI